MRKEKNIKKLMRLVPVVAMVIYSWIMIYLCSSIPLDSDRANHLLQAQDIAAGNLFLNGWNLTGVTFLTTDLLYYLVAYFLCGLSPKAIAVLGGLMIASATIVSFFLALQGQKDKLFKSLVTGLLLLVPCWDLLHHFRVHGGAVCFTLVSFAICFTLVSSKGKEKKGNRSILIGLFICLVLGAIGDMLFVIEAVVPIILLSGLVLLFEDMKEEKVKCIQLIAVSLGAVLISQIWDLFYFHVGSANKNSYIFQMNFAEVGDWTTKISSFIKDLLSLTNADFAGNKIGDIWNLLKIVNFFILIVSVFIGIHSITVFFKRQIEKVDYLSILLVFSIGMSFFAYLFTNMSEPRYISIIPLAATIVVVRNLDNIIETIKGVKLFKILVLLLGVAASLCKVQDLSLYTYPASNEREKELISYLNARGLNYGYASFWNASKYTVASDNEIKIRHILYNGNSFEMFNWFNKNEWYEENTNYILIDNSQGDNGVNDSYGVSVENATYYFGVPVEMVEYAGYIIMIYDYPLSMMLDNGIRDGILYPKELSVNENAVHMEDKIEISQWGFSYGPYDTVEEGDYKIVFYGDNMHLAIADAWSNTESDKIEYRELSKSKDKLEMIVKVRDKVEDIEFRLFNFDPETKVVLNKVVLE